ncbi:MAG TPA: hypothetical protein VES95_06570 [Dermatophilaceae bacterium]|nr:hypothetical protein [Dermatophilaceae bacterium]
MTDPAGRAVAGLALRGTWRAALAIAVANVVVTVTAVLGYVAAYPNPVDRLALARSIGANPGLTALFGETRALETIAGFTEWRVVLVLALVGAVWGLLATTRVLRGEEDAGRTEVLLAGPLRPTSVVVASLAGVGAALLGLLALTTLGLALGAGGDLGVARAVLLALTVVGAAASMVGVSAVTSQVAGTRRGAAGLAAAVLGLAYLVRVVADSGTGLRWLRWATPLGWLELAHPLTEPAVAPVVLLYLLGLAGAVVAVALVGRRDTGAGLLAGSGGRPPRTAWLGSPLGLAARLALGPAAGWAIGLGVVGALIGLVARTAADAMSGSSSGDVLGGLGIEESGTRAYVGVSYVLLSLALTLAAAGQVAAARDEEAAGRLDTLLVRPVSVVRWLVGRLAIAVALLAVGAAATAVGTASTGVLSGLGVPLGDLAVAALNTLPAALCILGLGTLLHGVVPRAAVPLTYAVVAGSFLLEVVGSTARLPGWLLGLSVLHHVAPAPAVEPDWASAAVLVGLGAVFAVGGALALRSRDVEPG